MLAFHFELSFKSWSAQHNKVIINGRIYNKIYIWVDNKVHNRLYNELQNRVYNKIYNGLHG